MLKPYPLILSIKPLLHLNMLRRKLQPQTFSLLRQRTPRLLMNRIVFIRPSGHFIIKLLHSAVMGLAHRLCLVSVVQLSLMLVLLLLLKIGIETTYVGVKLLLVCLMGGLLFRNLLSNFLDGAVEADSLRLGLTMSVEMLLNIKSVIIDDGAFGIQSNDGGLQSFDFDFLIGNCHLA